MPQPQWHALSTPRHLVPQTVCMFDRFHLTFNFKSKVSRDVFKNENECQLTSTFSSKLSPQCHMPSNYTRHFKIWMSIDKWLVHKSHYMSNSELIVCVNERAFYFCASFCLHVKCQHLQKLCQNYTLPPKPPPASTFRQVGAFTWFMCTLDCCSTICNSTSLDPKSTLC